MILMRYLGCFRQRKYSNVVVVVQIDGHGQLVNLFPLGSSVLFLRTQHLKQC